MDLACWRQSSMRSTTAISSGLSPLKPSTAFSTRCASAAASSATRIAVRPCSPTWVACSNTLSVRFVSEAVESCSSSRADPCCDLRAATLPRKASTSSFTAPSEELIHTFIPACNSATDVSMRWRTALRDASNRASKLLSWPPTCRDVVAASSDECFASLLFSPTVVTSSCICANCLSKSRTSLATSLTTWSTCCLNVLTALWASSAASRSLRSADSTVVRTSVRSSATVLSRCCRTELSTVPTRNSAAAARDSAPCAAVPASSAARAATLERSAALRASATVRSACCSKYTVALFNSSLM
mmetsp:Transcript_7890/g.20046  ORF Transcript_7890/g.20046 Transcript_7890/m.20046 type:complete len:301 (-) Transcript_7890:1058-1960(-)